MFVTAGGADQKFFDKKIRELRLVNILDGSSIKLLDYAGNYLLLGVGTLKCKFCIEAIQHINGLSEKHKDNGVVVVWTFISPFLGKKHVKKLASDKKITIPLTVGTDDLEKGLPH